MCKKIIISTILLVLLSYQCISQQVKLGHLVPIAKMLTYEPEVFADDDSSLYVFYASGKKYFVDEIRKDNLDRRKSLNFTVSIEKDYNLSHIAQIKLGGTIFIFYSKSDGHVYCSRLGENVPFAEQRVMSVNNNRMHPTFLFALSPDSTKMVIKAITYNKETREYEHQFSVFDANLHVVSSWASPFEISEYTVINELTIDNSGNVYFLKTLADGRSWLVSFWGRDHITSELFLDITGAINLSLVVPSGIHIFRNSLIVAGNILEYKPAYDLHYTFQNRKIFGTFSIAINLDDNTVLFRKTNLLETPKKIYDDLFIPYKQSVDENGNYVLVNEHYYESYNSSDYASFYVMPHNSDGSLIASQTIPLVFRPDFDELHLFRYAVTFDDNVTNVFVNDPAFDESFFPRKNPNTSVAKNPLKFSFSGNNKLNYSKDYRRCEYNLYMKSRVDLYNTGKQIYFIGKKGKYYRIGFLEDEEPSISGFSLR